MISNLVGLYVTNDEMYQSYREAMMPVLHRYGGGFGYDFKIAETLRSETDAPINRVFTIHFPDQETQDAFFSNEEYLKIKQQFFVQAISHTTIMDTYTRG
jgi:uncharacterized protein (DUF1330 family)